MSSLQITKRDEEEKTYYNYMISTIKKWPEWKIKSLCLEEVDIEIKYEIERYKS